MRKNIKKIWIILLKKRLEEIRKKIKREKRKKKKRVNQRPEVQKLKKIRG